MRPGNQLLVGIAVAAIISAAISSACGGGGDGTSPDQAEDTTAVDHELIELAEQALLRLDDFPTGWTERPAEEEDDQELDLPPECRWFTGRESFPGAVAEAESPEFHGPDDEEVQSGVTVFEDTAAASQSFADWADFLEECRDPVREALVESVEESAKDEDFEVGDIEVNIDRLSFPSLGEEHMSLRVSATVEVQDVPFDLDVYVDYLAIRIDRVAADVSYTDMLEIPDSAEEERLLRLLEERITGVAAQLD